MKPAVECVNNPNRPMERHLDQWPFPDRESLELDFVESMPLDVPAVLSMERFNRLEVRPGQGVVGAGTLLRDLHAAAQASGQFYPPDPTETGAAVGGNIATKAFQVPNRSGDRNSCK